MDKHLKESPIEECHRILATLKDHSCLVDRPTIIRCFEFLLKLEVAGVAPVCECCGTSDDLRSAPLMTGDMKRIICKYCYIAWYDFSGPSFDAESIARESRKLRDSEYALAARRG
jgi:hypothetical protein